MEDQEEDICRVCRSEGTSDNPLFYPCVCHGTIKYVHQDCLMQWLKYSKKQNCELCKHPYKFIPIYSPDMPRKIPVSIIATGIVNSIYKILKTWIHYTLVFIAWILMVPFTAARFCKAIFSLDFTILFPSSIISMNGGQILVNYTQGAFIVSCALCLFRILVWLKEQILATDEISAWLTGEDEITVSSQINPTASTESVNNNNNLTSTTLSNESSTNIINGDFENSGLNLYNALPTSLVYVESNYHNVYAQQNTSLITNTLNTPGLSQSTESSIRRRQAANGGQNNNNNIPFRFDIFSLNNIDWDRAVEELTWENLLGLDGTYNFLEHALWIVMFNAVFITLFAFVPYHYGKLVLKSLNLHRWIAASYFESFINIYVGYIFICLILVICRRIYTKLNYNRLTMVFSVCYLMIKVCLLLVLEIVIFPFICGWVLDICSLDLFSSSIGQRVKSFNNTPFLSTIMHWLFGLAYAFYFASLLKFIRDTLRPGLIWFIRGGTNNTNNNNINMGNNINNDGNNENNLTNGTLPPSNASNSNPNNQQPNRQANAAGTDDGNPIKELIVLPIYRHLTQFLTSWILFVFIIAFNVWIPVKCIKWLFPFLLPYTLFPEGVMDSVWTELPFELILFHSGIPSLVLEGNRIRNITTYIIRTWATIVGSMLGLQTYLLGQTNENNLTINSNDNSNNVPSANGNNQSNSTQNKPKNENNLGNKRNENYVAQNPQETSTSEQLPSTSYSPYQNFETKNDDESEETVVESEGTETDFSEYTISSYTSFACDDVSNVSDNSLSSQQSIQQRKHINSGADTIFGKEKVVKFPSKKNMEHPKRLNQNAKNIEKNTSSNGKNANQNSTQANTNSENPDLPNYERPSYFGLRIAAFIACLILTVICGSILLLTVPVVLGRLLFFHFPWESGLFYMITAGRILPSQQLSRSTFFSPTTPPSSYNAGGPLLNMSTNSRIIHNETNNQPHNPVLSIDVQPSYLNQTANTSFAHSITTSDQWIDDLMLSNPTYLYGLIFSTMAVYLIWLMWRSIERGIAIDQNPNLDGANIINNANQDGSNNQPILEARIDNTVDEGQNNTTQYFDNNHPDPLYVRGGERTYPSPILLHGKFYTLIQYFGQTLKQLISGHHYIVFRPASHQIITIYAKKFVVYFAVFAFNVINILALGCVFLGIIPLLIGIIMDVCIIIPLRVPMDRTPFIYLENDWLFGILVVKIIIALSLIFPPMTPPPGYTLVNGRYIANAVRPAASSTNAPVNTNNSIISNRSEDPARNNTIEVNNNQPSTSTTQHEFEDQSYYYIQQQDGTLHLVHNVVVPIGNNNNMTGDDLAFEIQSYHDNNTNSNQEKFMVFISYMGQIYGCVMEYVAHQTRRLYYEMYQHIRTFFMTVNATSWNRNFINFWPVWDLAWSITQYLGVILAFPYTFVYTISALLGLNAITRAKLENVIYPFVFSSIVLITFFVYQIKQMKRLYQHIKDERYLIGRRLVNFERKNKQTSQNTSQEALKTN